MQTDSVVGIINQSPNSIMRSAVLMPCLFAIVKSQKLAGQRS